MKTINKLKMKLKLFTLLFITTFVYSQDTIRKPNIHFGLKIGITIPTIKYDSGDSVKFSNNPYYGGFLEYQHKKLGFEIAGNYLEMHSKKTTKPENLNVPGVTGKDYFKIKSIMASLSVKYFAFNNFAIKLGGYNNFDIDSKHYLEKVFPSDPNYEDFKLKDSGILFGMEYYIYKGILIDTNVAIDLQNNDSLKVHYLLVGIGYKI